MVPIQDGLESSRMRPGPCGRLTRPFLVVFLLIKSQPIGKHYTGERKKKRELELGEERERERERGKSNRIQPGRSVEEGGGIGAGGRHGGPERGGARLQPLHLQRAAPRGLISPHPPSPPSPRSGCRFRCDSSSSVRSSEYPPLRLRIRARL